MGRTNNENPDDPGSIVGYFCFKYYRLQAILVFNS